MDSKIYACVLLRMFWATKLSKAGREYQNSHIYLNHHESDCPDQCLRKYIHIHCLPIATANSQQ